MLSNLLNQEDFRYTRHPTSLIKRTFEICGTCRLTSLIKKTFNTSHPRSLIVVVGTFHITQQAKQRKYDTKNSKTQTLSFLSIHNTYNFSIKIQAFLKTCSLDVKKIRFFLSIHNTYNFSFNIQDFLERRSLDVNKFRFYQVKSISQLRLKHFYYQASVCELKSLFSAKFSSCTFKELPTKCFQF